MQSNYEGQQQLPTYRSVTTAPDLNESAGFSAGLPIVPLIQFITHLFKGGTNLASSSSFQNPTTPAPPPEVTAQDPSGGMDRQKLMQLLAAIPSIAGLLATSRANTNLQNPALTSLNAQVPNLGQNLSALLASDVQRRQMSDPLYAAVIRGTQGGLPNWMQAGGSTSTGLGTPTVQQQPRTGGTPPGNDPGGYAYTRGM